MQEAALDNATAHPDPEASEDLMETESRHLGQLSGA